MKETKSKIIFGLLVIIAFFLGSNATVFFKDTATKYTPIVAEETVSPQLQKCQAEFKKIESEQDRLLIYKLFAGAGEYLSASIFTGSTGQFDPIIGKVQSSYGWKREKYPAFTDAVSEYLVSVGYDEPKQIVTSAEREAFSKIFKDLAKVLK